MSDSQTSKRRARHLVPVLLTAGLLAACATKPAAPTTPAAPPAATGHDKAGLRKLLPPSPETPEAVTRAPARAAGDWELIAVGDILLGGSAEPELREIGFVSPFSNYTEILRAADLAYGNLEGPVGVRGRPVADKTFTFQMRPAVLPALRDVGFDVLHLANNHILDFGPESLTETIDLTRDAGFAGCGAGANVAEARRPATFTTAGGVRFAFVCYSNTFPEEFWAGRDKPGTAFGHEAWVRADVAAARARADVVVAAFHWGTELMPEPKDYQRALARAAIEAGASAVLGHHPHVLQPLELIDGRPAVYSLGNFVFGSYSNKVRHSALLRLRGHGAQVREIAVLPIDVYNPIVNFHPRDLPEADARDVARFMLGDGAARQGRWWTISPQASAP